MNKLLIILLFFSLSCQCQTVRKNPYYCKPPANVAVASINYGYLYNWHTVNDARHITASNAHVPTDAEWTTLGTYLGGNTTAGLALKEVGTVHWGSPNTGATNSTGFNGRGGGRRTSAGTFEMFLSDVYFWGAESGKYRRLSSTFNMLYGSGSGIATTHGCALRLIIDTPIEINGTYAVYVGNDLTRYRCTLIGSQWWLADNLVETKFRNGDALTKVTNGTTWSGLTTEGYCSYNNTDSNVFE
jgi:uncharacterized protein (TIGR02145 family)